MILLFTALAWLVALIVVWQRARHLVRDVLAIGVIGVATAGFFWRMLFGGAWIPAGGGDLANFLYPTYKFSAEWWQRGVIPLWNPYLFAGQPFLGDIQSALFYPINLLAFFLSPSLAFRDMEFLSVLHFFIAGAGMYLFLRFGRVGATRVVAQSGQPRELPLHRAACFAGAIAFEYSDLFITHFGNLNLIATAAWMPLVLLFYRRAVLDRRAGLAVVSGMFLALAFHAGHVQAFMFIVVALGVFAVYHIIDERPRTDDERLSSLVVRHSFIFVVVALVAIGLSAPALVPAVEFTQHTVRAEFSYPQAAEFSLPPAQLIGLFVPGFFGRGPQNAWGPWQRVEVGYIGILPLALALFAILFRRDSFTKFCAIFSLVGLALALGEYAIPHGWLYQFFPGFGQLRAPARFIFLLDFGVAALAALGFNRMLHALPRAFKTVVRIAPWVFLSIALAAGCTIYAMLILGQGQDAILFQRIANAANAIGFFILLLALSLGLILTRATRWFHPTGWATAALLLIFFDLFSLGASVDISPADPSEVFEHPDVVAFLKSDANFYRIDPRGTNVDTVWTADTGLVHNLSSVDGDNPLILSNFNKYWNGMGSRSSALYDLLNAKYVLGRKGLPLDRSKFKLVFDGDPALSIYENTRVRPRAFIALAAQVAPSHTAAWEMIRKPDFDPSRTVIVEGDVLTPTHSELGVAAVRIIGYGPNAIVLETYSASGGFLVLSEIFYPGWRGFVDDREVTVLRANFLFRAIELPAGAQRVRFQYDPASFKVGLGLFGATVIALAAWMILNRRG